MEEIFAAVFDILGFVVIGHAVVVAKGADAFFGPVFGPIFEPVEGWMWLVMIFIVTVGGFAMHLNWSIGPITAKGRARKAREQEKERRREFSRREFKAPDRPKTWLNLAEPDYNEPDLR